MDKNGEVGANGNFVKIALQKGGFEVDSTALNAKLNKAQPNIDKATCSFSFSGSGRVRLLNGTGLYTGLSGSANVTLCFGGVGPRLTIGAKRGQCNPSQNANPLSQYGAVIGTGVVNFGSSLAFDVIRPVLRAGRIAPWAYAGGGTRTRMTEVTRF